MTWPSSSLRIWFVSAIYELWIDQVFWRAVGKREGADALDGARLFDYSGTTFTPCSIHSPSPGKNARKVAAGLKRRTSGRNTRI
jgi:hypothetical protein